MTASRSLNKLESAGLLFVAALFQASAAQADTGAVAANSRRSTDIQVTSSDRNLFSDDKKERPDRFTFFRRDDTGNPVAMDINEEGEPNLNMRF
jgi:hypothetical protein